jgi:hypothetical protein
VAAELLDATKGCKMDDADIQAIIEDLERTEADAAESAEHQPLEDLGIDLEDLD